MEEETHQLLKNTAVQLHLLRTALPELVVVVLKTLPVSSERLQAVGVDVLDSADPLNQYSFCGVSSLNGPLENQLNRTGMGTYTLAAQRVTFLPSFRQSSSPRPFDSSLHFIKSSL